MFNEKCVEYCSKDSENTARLRISIHNVGIQIKIEKLHKKMDLFDDIQYREQIAKQIFRLKAQML